MTKSDDWQIENLPEWTKYKEEPIGKNLGALLSVVPSKYRNSLIASLENLFFDKKNWRISQHLTLIHLDRLAPYSNSPDFVKAFYFAHKACQLSQDHPLARLSMGYLNWERRLPAGVLYDVETIRRTQKQLLSELNESQLEKLIGESFVLEGMAKAYLLQVDDAHRCMVEAERRNCLSLAAIVQLLSVSELTHPEVAFWAVYRIPKDVVLGGLLKASQLRIWKQGFISVLRKRAKSFGD